MTSSTLSRILLVLGLAALCAHVALIWWFRFPPMSDYPDWLLQANILAHYHDPGYHYATWYRLILSPVPNLGFIAPATLLSLIMPVETAGKVVLTLCMIGFVIAFRKYLAACAGPAAAWLLGILLLFNISFQNGNIGFLIGVSGLLLLVSRDLSHGATIRLSMPVNLLAVVLLFLAHALPALVYFLYLLLKVFTGSTTREERRDFAARGVMLAALAALYFVTRPHENILQPFSYEPGWRYRLSTLAKSFVGSWPFPPYRFSVLQSGANVLMFLCVISLAFTALKNREVRHTAHGKVALLVVLMALVAPKSILGIGEPTQRFALVGFVLLAGFTGRRKVRNTALSLCLSLLLVLVTCVRFMDYSQAGTYLEERFSFVGGLVPPGTPILTMDDRLGSEKSFFPQFVPKGATLIHQNDYLLLRGGFNPWSYRTGLIIPRIDLVHDLDSLQRVRQVAGLGVLRGSDIPPSISWVVIDATTGWADTMRARLGPEFRPQSDSVVHGTIRTVVLRRTGV